MRFEELSGEQRRQMIDAKQAFNAWRQADQEFRHSYRKEMHWHKVGGHEYLYRKFHKVWEQIGPRSSETEQIKRDYTAQRTALRSRLTRLQKRLEGMDRLNKAMGLGRVPDIAARVLRKLDERDLLGNHVFVAGTHALYAYEVRAGIFFGGELTATTDIDFLWDVRQRFTFLMQDVHVRGVIGLLQQVDPTFKRTRSYQATNSDPYLVELIRPERKNEVFKPNPKISAAEGDLEPAAIEGLNWLLHVPKFDEVVIGENGRPLSLSCIDPRAFALHKLWMSKRKYREPIKQRRDELQAHAAAAAAIQYMGLKFDRQHLSALPKELAAGANELAKANTDK